MNEVDFCASIHDTLKLEGKWARVVYNGQKGYVFDANCVPFKVRPIMWIEESMAKETPPFSLMGDVIPGEDAVNKQSNEMETNIHFTRGNYLKKWDEEGCYHEIYTFYKLNFMQFIAFCALLIVI